MVITPKHAGAIVIVMYILIPFKNNSFMHQLVIKNVDSSRMQGTNVKTINHFVSVR